MGVTSPRVSVVMTTYNGGPLVRETVASILNQSFTDFELIILDDCSTNNTFEILRQYNDPRIRLFQNEENQGISNTRNRAIALATGEYIAATDQDDISLPKRLEREIAYLDENSSAVLVATATKELRNGKTRSLYDPEMRSHIIAWRLFTRSAIVHSSICYRRKEAENLGIRYQPEYHYAEDFVLFHQFAKAGDIAILPEPLVLYREHETNASTLHTQEMHGNVARFLAHAFCELGVAVTIDDIERLWQVFNLNEATVSEGDLLTAGGVYARGLEAFLRKSDLSAQQEGEVRQWASTDWWRVVSSFCRRQGRMDSQNLYRKIPVLSTQRPSARSLAGTNLRALLRKVAR